MKHNYEKTPEELAAELGTDAERGLTSAAA